MAETGVDEAGVGVAAAAVEAATPDRTLIVESSRSAVVRPEGNVPYQPGEGWTARER